MVIKNSSQRLYFTSKTISFRIFNFSKISNICFYHRVHKVVDKVCGYHFSYLMYIDLIFVFSIKHKLQGPGNKIRKIILKIYESSSVNKKVHQNP